MLSSVTDVNGTKRVSINNTKSVVIELPEGFTFTSQKVGESIVVRVEAKEAVMPIRSKMFKPQKEKNVRTNANVLKKKRNLSPRLTPEQKADVIKLFGEGMNKKAISRTMNITYQQVNYCLKTFA